MGGKFCGNYNTRNKIFNPKNSSMYQLNRYYTDQTTSNIFNDDSSISSSSNKDNHNDLKIRKEKIIKENQLHITNKFQLLSYDSNENKTYKLEIKFPISLSLDGLSELNYKKSLFLCGNSNSQNSDSAFLFQISPEDQTAKIKVHSRYSHYYPSLINDFKDRIYCIGGKLQIHCEEYDVNYNHWNNLPKLTEERYKCTLCISTNINFMYLFGGYNENKIEKSILRMDLCEKKIWEVINIKNNKSLLNIISGSALIFDGQEEFIYILGGEGEDKKMKDDVIKFNINDNSVESTGRNLKYPTRFNNQVFESNDGYIYYLFDCFNRIHLIDKHEYIIFCNKELKLLF